MNRILKHAVAIYKWIFIKKRGLIEKFRVRKEYHQLLKQGVLDVPIHTVKQNNLRALALSFGCKTLVETGTYMGDMIEALKKDFDKIYSIELSPDLYKKALFRFDNYASVHLVQGDSAKKLPAVMSLINGPAIFWLDGHYCGSNTSKGDIETPILSELETVLQDKRYEHIIVIDDARLFHGSGDYPTFEELRKLVNSIKPEMQVIIKDDAIRILPKKLPLES